MRSPLQIRKYHDPSIWFYIVDRQGRPWAVARLLLNPWRSFGFGYWIYQGRVIRFIRRFWSGWHRSHNEDWY